MVFFLQFIQAITFIYYNGKILLGQIGFHKYGVKSMFRKINTVYCFPTSFEFYYFIY